MPITPLVHLGTMIRQTLPHFPLKSKAIGMTSLLNLTAIRFQEGFREEWKQERTQLVTRLWVKSSNIRK